MWKLFQIELFKIFKRPRTYISFAAIALIVILIQFAFYSDGKAYMEFAMQTLKQNFDISGNALSGYFICFIVLQTLLIHVPLLIALVGGDMLAGEANMGTLRLLISKPVSRTELMLAKFSATFVYTMLLLMWMAFLALFVSLLIFGSGDLINLKSGSVHILSFHLYLGDDTAGHALFANDVLWRYIAAFGFASIAMTTIAALSFLLSVFAENSIGPIVSTMSIVILFTILTTLDLPVFTSIKDYLFTSHMIGWKGFFEYPPGMSVEEYKTFIKTAGFFSRLGLYPGVMRSAAILVAHIILFVSAAIIVFKRKDVLS